MDPGGYEAVLVHGEGDELARVSFWLRDPQAETEVSTDRRTYGRGEPIEVELERRPCQPLGLASGVQGRRAGPEHRRLLDWDYTELHAAGTVPPSTDGSVTFGHDAQGGPWPLPPGRYVVHYLLADQYKSAGGARFTVGAEVGSQTIEHHSGLVALAAEVACAG